MRAFVALAVAGAFALLIAPAGHAARGHGCGLTPRIQGIRYQVREVRGQVPCRRVKRVVTRFLRRGTVAAPWACFRGHGSSPYAASCARGRRVLRVYAPT